MARSLLSRVLTVALMAAVLWVFGYKRRAIAPQAQATLGGEPREPRPAVPEDSIAEAPVESVVWRMVDASRAGDPSRYLDCYT